MTLAETGAARDRLRGARSVFVLTGAGISAESGIPTFRGGGSAGQESPLWDRFRPEDLATPDAFGADPRLVWEWYDWRRGHVAAARPNAGHLALAALEARVPELLVATQNVDGLHAQAGSRRLVELHGSVWQVRCVGCGRSEDDRRVPLPDLPPRCACGALLRPGVVWFGETLPPEPWARAFAAAREAEVVLVVGTSAIVYPAATLPRVAPSAFIVEINPEETPLTPDAAVSLRMPAAEALPALVEAR